MRRKANFEHLQLRNTLTSALASQQLTPNDINYVICTHGRLPHVGNLNLFQNAIMIVGKDICMGTDRYVLHDFQQDRSFEIDEHVHVMYLPGHTASDVSVLVQTYSLGRVAITGNIFHQEADLEDPSQWMEHSEDQERQERSRLKILRMADVIVPGHGPMFRLKPGFKRHISIKEVDAGSQTPDSDQDMLS